MLQSLPTTPFPDSPPLLLLRHFLSFTLPTHSVSLQLWPTVGRSNIRALLIRTVTGVSEHSEQSEVPAQIG